MIKTQMVPTKATSLKERSDAIVVSFAPGWHQAIIDRTFTAVIRKRVPRELSPKWLYFHVNAPVSAIVAKAEISSLVRVSLQEAVGLRDQLALTEAEITDYFGGYKEVGCYKLGAITFPARPVTTTDLREKLLYTPPQNYVNLSRAAKAIVDRLAGFPNGQTPRRSQELGLSDASIPQ
jgi:predicted transcriptional regulator